MKCSNCKKIISWQWRYCPFCAIRLRGTLYFAGLIIVALSAAVIAISFNLKHLNIAVNSLASRNQPVALEATASQASDTEAMEEKVINNNTFEGEKALIGVSGRIEDYKGDPVIGARVSLGQVTYVGEKGFNLTNENYWKIPDWSSNYSVITDNDGCFYLDLYNYKENELHMYGLYFQVLPKNKTSKIKSSDIVQNPEAIAIDLESRNSNKIELGTIVARQGGAIRIKITDEDENPVENDVMIEIVKHMNSSSHGGLTGGIKDGIYISDAYPAGKYSIKVGKDGYRTFVKNNIIINEGEITDVRVILSK